MNTLLKYIFLINNLSEVQIYICHSQQCVKYIVYNYTNKTYIHTTHIQFSKLLWCNIFTWFQMFGLSQFNGPFNCAEKGGKGLAGPGQPRAAPPLPRW